MKHDRPEGELVPVLNPVSFRIVQQIAQRHLGFHISKDKLLLISRRLGLMRKELGATTLEDLVRNYLSQPTDDVLTKLANHLTTNHTYFHREPEHFERLSKDVLPALLSACKEKKDLRVWCAASSTGQEPYELAMRIRELLGPNINKWKAGVLATDISQRVLDHAIAGAYTADEVEALPLTLRQKYMHRNSQGLFQVCDTIRNDLMFRRLNLQDQTFPFHRRFQIIFCRNVMIYFDRPTRNSVIAKLIQNLEPGGYLFVGRAESARGFEESLEYVEAGMYCKRQGQKEKLS